MSSSCKEQQGPTQQPLNSITREAAALKLSLNSPGDAPPHRKISYSTTPPLQKRVTHQFQTVTFHSQTIPGAAGSVRHGDVGKGEEGGKSQIAKGRPLVLCPHTGMLLLNFRTAQSGTCWQIPLEENNKTSTFQKGGGEGGEGTSDAIPSQPGGTGRAVCSPELLDVRKCSVPTSHSSCEFEPCRSALLLRCDADPGFTHQPRPANDEQMRVQWDDDNRGATKKSLSAPGPERSFVSHYSSCPRGGDVTATSRTAST